MRLSTEHPLFIGFKLDGGLRRQLQGLTGPDRRYVSADDSTFLLMCRKDEAFYIGKLIEDGLTTDRVDDVTRNVLSIMRRLCPDTRLPNTLEIWPITKTDEEEPAPEASAEPKSSPGGW